MTREEEIKKVHAGGTHVVILGAGASIASTIRNPEKQGNILPSMDNIIEVVGLENFIKGLPSELKRYKGKFETFYSKLTKRTEFIDTRIAIEERIGNYFKQLELPECPTIYDYLIISLRPKDVIATFNWDPFLYLSYNRIGSFTKTPGILFLHGNVAIGYSEEDDCAGPAGWCSKSTGSHFNPTKLLYPIEIKDYNSDPFTKGQWEALSLNLKIAERVTIFGYRAPKSDFEAMKLLREAWGTPDQRDMEQFELIDVRPEEEIKKSWKNFIHTHHYNYWDSFFECSIARHPRRTIESYRHWARPLTLSEAFQEGNRVPENFSTFEEMWKWYTPLIEAEKEFYKKSTVITP